MKVTYSDNVKQSSNDFPLLQRATERLAKIVDPATENLEPLFGPEESQVLAKWDSAPNDQRGTSYTLNLTGLSTGVSATFSPKDLADDSGMPWRLGKVWDDLLTAYLRTSRKKYAEFFHEGNNRGEADAR